MGWGFEEGLVLLVLTLARQRNVGGELRKLGAIGSDACLSRDVRGEFKATLVRLVLRPVCQKGARGVARAPSCDWTQRLSIRAMWAVGIVDWLAALGEPPAAIMGTESGLRPLCESLDRLLLRYLRDVESLMERRGRLEKRMEQDLVRFGHCRSALIAPVDLFVIQTCHSLVPALTTFG
eukprot:g38928.t1